MHELRHTQSGWILKTTFLSRIRQHRKGSSEEVQIILAVLSPEEILLDQSDRQLIVAYDRVTVPAALH